MMDNVWVPDVFFRNEKEGNFHEVTVPNKYMHLKPSGHVIYSMRSASAGPLGVGGLSLTLNCRMDLNKYPLDSQRCPMLIQSSYPVRRRPQPGAGAATVHHQGERDDGLRDEARQDKAREHWNGT
ncbi:hypothetical protein C0Q70_05454 [Pomacea canaliculata]|uniref:Neurotransmitter-gated ion-channel ligand-binding domain-containing protein n=1 Tax=Pomacea canaliculata TaxID=400727 RepID=A0A2T7PL94_POMCA|nr:hypothetical protein C0Q70_05454 [Pomacea canaliculata]